ncbi:hypothetical protein TON_1162 [Thermococcus onnurineus NA1]|uniref:HEPN domain-containing protein n=1 Tax=Thermococcus onnurineus (strain NA1) TaxID=523850 RepID=B6YX37_THEON|nr:hypothetical protein [Thermococcus onnurineus]ACJ16650.1 hypothetical protein TON_1162 [Thermococcus onnurineus NA1]
MEVAKYSLWDMLDSLKGAEDRNDPSSGYLYHLALSRALEVYSKFLGVEIPPASKVCHLFGDKGFRKAYMFGEFPDREFVGLFLNALERSKAENLERVITHIFKRMGGFNINGWRLRTKALDSL